MPSIFSTLRTRKMKTHLNDTLKRTLPTTTLSAPTSHLIASYKSSSDSGSRYSQASGGMDSTTTALSSSRPPPFDSSEKKERDSDTDVVSTLAPTPKTLLLQPEPSREVKSNPPAKLIRKCSKVSFSDMKFGGTSMLGGGYGRKSQHHDKERLSDIKMSTTTQVSTTTMDGRGDEKEDAVATPIHGIMKTATNVSVGAGTHSVRFTLDLPPKLDLDLSLSIEKVGDGGVERKDGGEVVKESSRWGQRTEEAVLDRSKVVSTEFLSREDGREGNEGLMERHEDEDVSLKDPNDQAISLHEQQQSIQRDYSHTSSISTLECEPSFTFYRLEDLAAGVEPRRSGRKGHPVLPTLGRIPSGQERASSQSMNSYGIEEVARNSVMSSSSKVMMRKGGHYHQSNGCVSA